MRSVFKIYMMNRIANEAACLGYRMNWNRQRKGGAHLISVRIAKEGACLYDV